MKAFIAEEEVPKATILFSEAGFSVSNILKYQNNFTPEVSETPLCINFSEALTL
jgi:hypothetical protein